MKKLLIAIISMVLLLTLCSCDNDSCLKFELKDDGTYSVSAKASALFCKEIVIPDMYNGKQVTEIEDRAFYVTDNSFSLTFPRLFGNRIKSVTIPDSVTSIGDYAFCRCDNLTSITIPDSVISIGSDAFNDCDNLASVTIGSSVTSIGDDAFWNCGNLTSITIPDSVISIGSCAFSNCDNLASVTIGCSVTSIGSGAFSECCNLTSITIPNSVTSIGRGAFFECCNLRSVTIGSSVTTLGDFVFYGCDNLTSVVLTDGITTEALSELSILESIRYNKFDNGYYLGNDTNPYLCLVKVDNSQSIIINDNARIIYGYAFWGCYKLTSITIPANITSISGSAFWSCTALNTIIVDANNQHYTAIDGNLYTKDGTTLIKYVSGKTEDRYIIPDGVVRIGESAFANATNLKKIVIPDTITEIGANTFGNCENVTLYCEVSTKPDGWDKDWNFYQSGNYYLPVVWGYTGE